LIETPNLAGSLGEKDMTRKRQRRKKRGILRIMVYIVLMFMVGIVVILADAMSEQIDYDADTIKYGGALFIGLILLIDITQGMWVRRRASPTGVREKKSAATGVRAEARKKKAVRTKVEAVSKKKAVEPEVAKEEEEFDKLERPKKEPSPYAAELRSLEARKKQPERKIISYPPEVPGGKYGDCYIPIDKYTILKVRTLLALPEEEAEEVTVEEGGQEEYEEYEAYEEGAQEYQEGEYYEEYGEEEEE